MLIPCESCGTTYELDAQLIPAGGAPVQCTQCSHIFIAFPPARAETPPLGAPRPGAEVTLEPEPEPEPSFPPLVQDAPASPGGTFVFSVPREVFAEEGGPTLSAEPLDRGPSTPARSATQVFASTVANQPAPRAGTQVFAAPVSQQPQAGRAGTQVFAAPVSRQPPPGRAGTQVFAAPVSGQPPPATRAGTQIFATAPGGTGAQPEQEPVAPLSAPEALRGGFGAAIDGGTFDADREAQAVVRERAGTQQFASPPAARSASLPALPSLEGAAAPPERRDAPPSRTLSTEAISASIQLPEELPDFGAAEASDFELEKGYRNRRRNLFLLGIAACAALVALASTFGPRLLARERVLSPDAVAARAEALRLLRKDDPSSRLQASAKLDELIRAVPDYVELRGDRLLLRALHHDDLQMQQRRHDSARQRIRRQIETLRTHQAPGDWENRVFALEAELATAEREHKLAMAEVAKSEVRLASALAELRALTGEFEVDAQRALAAAEAMALASRGDDGALGVAERYRMRGGADGWDVLAEATFAANATTPPETLARVRASLEQVQKLDRGFLRAFIVDARLALQQGEAAAATPALETVATFHPTHPSVALLRGWAEELAAGADR